MLTWEEVREINAALARLEGLPAAVEKLADRLRSVELNAAAAATSSQERRGLNLWVRDTIVIIISALISTVPWWWAK